MTTPAPPDTPSARRLHDAAAELERHAAEVVWLEGLLAKEKRELRRGAARVERMLREGESDNG